MNLAIILGLLLGPSAFAATTRSDIHVWPKGEIPYVIEKEMPAPVKKVIQQAIARINSLKIVKFYESSTSNSKILAVFTHREGTCSSTIGWPQGASAMIMISEACTYGRILHELLHTLGMVHEQANPTKPFVINYDRLATSWNDQYQYENTVALTEHDAHSIMHYHSFDNSICTFLLDKKWNELPVSRLPHESCRHYLWQQLRAENNFGVDCHKECAVFLHPDAGSFGGEREDISELDIQGIKKLYSVL